MIPPLEDPRDARLRVRLILFGYLFVTVAGMAFVTGFTTGDRSDWFIGAVLLPFGPALLWRSSRDVLDRRTLVLFIGRVALFGAVLGAAISPYVGHER